MKQKYLNEYLPKESILNNTLDNVIKYLKNLKTEYKGWKDLSLDWDGDLWLTGNKPKTKKELEEERKEAEKREAAFQAIMEKSEREQLKRLKEKYENGISN